MDERVNYSYRDRDHDDEELKFNDTCPDEGQDHLPTFPQDLDSDLGYDTAGTGVEDHQEQHLEDHQVDHQVDHDTDDRPQANYDDKFGAKAKSRRLKKGKRIPEDIRGYRWPVFVKFSELLAELKERPADRNDGSMSNGK